MNRNLLMIIETLTEFFNQDWIINFRANILKTCEEMIPLLKGR